MMRKINRGAALQIMQVADVYVLDSGTVECDLIDRNGRLFTGCSIMSLGGGDIDFSAAPKVNSEVICVTEPRATPYIIGALAESQSYKAQVDLTSGGEYPANELEIFDIQLKNKGTRLIASDQALYAMPRLRVQGQLEISDGNAPAQSLTLAEPLIDLLNSYRTAITELQTAVQELGLALAANNPPIPVSLPQLSQIGPANDTIASELVSVEK